jgi:hypothetical protein
VAAKNDAPLNSTKVFYTSAYVPIVYDKGSVVVDMLRLEVGEEALFKGLAGLCKDFDRDYARVADLREAVEKASGQELGWYFKQWFDGTGSIQLEVAGRVEKNAAGGWDARLRISQLSAKPLRFKLPVWFELSDGSTDERVFDVNGDKAIEVLSASFEKKPVRLRPDPKRLLLRLFSILTPGDANLDGLVDGADLVEMAFRHRRSIVVGYKGKEHLMPNSGWDELFDLESNGKVDDADVQMVVDHLGEEGIDF